VKVVKSGWEIKEEYREIFIEESQEQIEDWETSLLKLETNPSDIELINQLFRSIHTLKGSAGFVGFDKLQELNHDLESLLQDVRDEKLKLSESIIELMFDGLDITRRMIKSFSEEKDFEEDTSDFLNKLKKYSNDETTVRKKEKETLEESGEKNEVNKVDLNERDIVETSEEKSGGMIYKIEIEINAGNKEAYLRALLIQHRFEEVGKVITIAPPLEELKTRSEPFHYQVVVESYKEIDALEMAANIDLVKVIG